MNNADANYLDIYDMIYERAVADIDNPDQIKPIPEADLKWKLYTSKIPNEGVVKHIKYNPFKANPIPFKR
jgi:hypothetical protein